MTRRFEMKAALAVTMAVALAWICFGPARAEAAFPGGNGPIAFSSEQQGNRDIYVAGPGAGTPTRLTDDAAADFDPAFSPDGTKIAFVSGRDGDNEIYVMNADGTDQHRVTDSPGDDLEPAWSPNGQRLLIQRQVEGDAEVFAIDATDGGNATNLTQTPGADSSPEFSPDGTKIVFRRQTDELGAKIFLMNADGTGQANLTGADPAVTDGHPSFAPSGLRIAYESDVEDARNEIYTMDLTGADRTRITNIQDGISAEPAYSPDGKQIAFRSGASPSSAISIVTLDDGTVSQLTGGADDASPSWQVDNTAPTTTITAPANGTETADTSLDVEFSSEAGATFECRLDEGDWAACASPWSIGPLSDGPHQVSVRATDLAGNVEAQPPVAGFTVDTTGPQVTFTATPPLIAASGDAQFTYSANEDVSAWECRTDSTDDADWATCSSPTDLTGLADGDHTFQVRATDDLGNTGPATGYTWTVDSVVPTANISQGPEATTNEITAWFHFTSDVETATFECRLDPAGGAPWTACDSGISYEQLADGQHVFQVRAIGRVTGAGPVAQWDWTVDTVSPRVAFVSGPAAVTTLRDASFEMSANKPGMTIECALDDAPAAPCGTSLDLTDLAPGDHTLLIQGYDAGGEAVNSASWSWTILAAAPQATITSAPTGLVGSRAAILKFKSDVPQAVFECSRDGGPWQACASPAFDLAPADGPRGFAVRALLPGEAPGPEAGAEWSIDTSVPAVEIVGGPVDRVASADAAFQVQVPGQIAAKCQIDAEPWAPCGNETSFTGLADGAHVLRARAQNSVGTVGWARRDWVVDTTGPSVSFRAKPAKTTKNRDARFAFVTNDPEATFECRLDGGEWSTCSSPVTYPQLQLGAHAFEVRATDDLGNVGQIQKPEWTIVKAMPKGLKPTIKIASRLKLDDSGTARIAVLGCPEGRCRITAPKQLKIRLKGHRITPGLKTPRGPYAEKKTEIMLITSAGARKVIGRYGPVSVSVKLSIKSDNGKTTTKTVRVKLTAR